jgi:DNA end-binding protein Ku
MWKGTLHVAQHSLGVKLYAALQDRDVHFKLLERRRRAPVSQRMVNPETAEPVEYATIQKGYFSDGSYVMLSKEELAALAPKASREIEVETVVGDDKLGPEWFVRPYYLGPDGNVDRYSALARALFEEKREGIARWVMRGVEYTGVLRSDGQHLMLITLRHKDEVVSAADLPEVKGRAHSEREEKLAEQLILAYEADFDPAAFKNEHRDRVLSLIEAKAAGKRPRLPTLQKKKAAPDLADALKKSLLHAHGKARGEQGDARRSAREQNNERPKLAKARAHSRRRKERAVA